MSLFAAIKGNYLIPVNRPDIGLRQLLRLFYPNTTCVAYEEAFGEWLGGEKSCLMTSSGKMAIYLLFKFLGLKGNVVTSPLTCSMALKPIVATGLDLKFVDVDPSTLNIDTHKLRQAIDEQTRAIFVVHLGGVPNNMEEIVDIARENNLLVIEDCAQALGTTLNGKKAGTFGDFSCFSFSKNMWLSGGGMIVSHDSETLGDIREFQNEMMGYIPGPILQYRVKRDLIESKRGGHFPFDFLYSRLFLKTASNANPPSETDLDKYFNKPGVFHRPSDAQASVLASQLEMIDEQNTRRQENAEELRANLGENVRVQEVPSGAQPVFSKLYVTTPYPSRLVIEFLMSKGIDAKHLNKSHGLYMQERFDNDSLFQEMKGLESCKEYLLVHDQIVALPISSRMSKRELYYIAEQLNGYCPISTNIPADQPKIRSREYERGL